MAFSVAKSTSQDIIWATSFIRQPSWIALALDGRFMLKKGYPSIIGLNTLDKIWLTSFLPQPATQYLAKHIHQGEAYLTEHYRKGAAYFVEQFRQIGPPTVSLISPYSFIIPRYSGYTNCLVVVKTVKPAISSRRHRNQIADKNLLKQKKNQFSFVEI